MDPAQDVPRAIASGGSGTGSSRGSRVAFFGGSFDPPHLGHVAVARAARAALDLDTVLFAPVGAQPLKPRGVAAPFADRLAMTSLAIAGEEGFAVSRADAPEPNHAPNYTLETLERLAAGLGAGVRFFCLMGADSFLSLRQWHRSAEIPFVAALIVASRPGQPLVELRAALPEELHLERTAREHKNGIELDTFALTGPGERRAPFYVLPGLNVEIAASAIRSQLRSGDGPGLSGALAAPVADYIRAHHLYR